MPGLLFSIRFAWYLEILREWLRSAPSVYRCIDRVINTLSVACAWGYPAELMVWTHSRAVKGTCETLEPNRQWSGESRDDEMQHALGNKCAALCILCFADNHSLEQSCWNILKCSVNWKQTFQGIKNSALARGVLPPLLFKDTETKQSFYIQWNSFCHVKGTGESDAKIAHSYCQVKFLTSYNHFLFLINERPEQL